MDSKQLEKIFPLFLILGVVLGFLVPDWFHALERSVIYIVMIIIGILFLKLDLHDTLTHFKRPVLLIYVMAVHLFAIPAITFFLFKDIAPDLSKGIFLLACLPSGVSAAVFTDIMKARTGLTMTAFIWSNFMSAFSIPFMFFTFYHQEIGLDAFTLMGVHLKILFVPFVIAMLIRFIVFKIRSTSLKPYTEVKMDTLYNVIILSCVSLMMMIAISHDAEYILSNIGLHLKTVLLLFVCFILFQLLSYASVFWLKKGERIAISTSKMIMNNILGIVLALAFFNENVVTVVILSFLPWSVLIVLKHWYKKYLP